MSHETPIPPATFTQREIHLPRGTRDLVQFNHTALIREIRAAQAYASRHNGDLPQTALLDAAVKADRQDHQLFVRLHQCPALLALLRDNDRHDINAPIIGGEPDAPIIPPACPPVTCVSVPQQPVPQVVPEPGSMCLSGLGLMVVVAWVFKPKKGAR